MRNEHLKCNEKGVSFGKKRVSLTIFGLYLDDVLQRPLRNFGMSFEDDIMMEVDNSCQKKNIFIVFVCCHLFFARGLWLAP